MVMKKFVADLVYQFKSDVAPVIIDAVSAIWFPSFHQNGSVSKGYTLPLDEIYSDLRDVPFKVFSNTRNKETTLELQQAYLPGYKDWNELATFTISDEDGPDYSCYYHYVNKVDVLRGLCSEKVTTNNKAALKEAIKALIDNNVSLFHRLSTTDLETPWGKLLQEWSAEDVAELVKKAKPEESLAFVRALIAPKVYGLSGFETGVLLQGEGFLTFYSSLDLSYMVAPQVSEQVLQQLQAKEGNELLIERLARMGCFKHHGGGQFLTICLLTGALAIGVAVMVWQFILSGKKSSKYSGVAKAIRFSQNKGRTVHVVDSVSTPSQMSSIQQRHNMLMEAIRGTIARQRIKNFLSVVLYRIKARPVLIERIRIAGFHLHVLSKIAAARLELKARSDAILNGLLAQVVDIEGEILRIEDWIQSCQKVFVASKGLVAREAAQQEFLHGILGKKGAVVAGYTAASKELAKVRIWLTRVKGFADPRAICAFNEQEFHSKVSASLLLCNNLMDKSPLSSADIRHFWSMARTIKEEAAQFSAASTITRFFRRVPAIKERKTAAEGRDTVVSVVGALGLS